MPGRVRRRSGAGEHHGRPLYLYLDAESFHHLAFQSLDRMLTEFYQAARDVCHTLVGVTGATSNIGRAVASAIAAATAAEGAHDVVSGRNEERGDRIADGYSRDRL